MTLYLIAYSAGHGVAFDTAAIDSVVDLGVVVPIPSVDPTVSGLTALRSRVLTVIDAGAALGQPGNAAEGRRAVVAEVEGHFYAFAVDALDDVVEGAARPLTAGMMLGPGWARAATGFVERGDETILVIDVTGLVPAAALPASRAA